MSGAVSVSERTGHVICFFVGFLDGDVLVSATGAMRENLVMRRGFHRNETLVSVYGMCGL